MKASVSVACRTCRTGPRVCAEGGVVVNVDGAVITSSGRGVVILAKWQAIGINLGWALIKDASLGLVEVSVVRLVGGSR